MRRIILVAVAILVFPAAGFVGDIVTDGKFKSSLNSGPP